MSHREPGSEGFVQTWKKWIWVLCIAPQAAFGAGIHAPILAAGIVASQPTTDSAGWRVATQEEYKNFLDDRSKQRDAYEHRLSQYVSLRNEQESLLKEYFSSFNAVHKFPALCFQDSYQLQRIHNANFTKEEKESNHEFRRYREVIRFKTAANNLETDVTLMNHSGQWSGEHQFATEVVGLDKISGTEKGSSVLGHSPDRRNNEKQWVRVVPIAEGDYAVTLKEEKKLSSEKVGSSSVETFHVTQIVCR